MTSFQDGGLLLSTWKSYPIPVDKSTLERYEKSAADYAVYMKYGDVYATRELIMANQSLPFLITSTPADSGKLTGNRSVLQTNEGNYLVAFYRAAGGGSLYQFDATGKRKSKIAELPVVKLLEGEKGTFAVVADTIHGIVKVNNGRISPFKRLASTALAADMDDAGNIIVITDKALLSVNKTGAVHVLIAKGYWNGYLFPRSLVAYNGKVYVGMRNGVLTYDLATKKTEWLMEK
jgi:outer membrane protein assembly factor BamB